MFALFEPGISKGHRFYGLKPVFRNFIDRHLFITGFRKRLVGVTINRLYSQNQINPQDRFDITQQAIDSSSLFTVANIVATPYRTTTVSIHLVSVDNSQMHICSVLKTQRNTWVTP